MADGDELLFEVARHGLHSHLTSPAQIAYRQQVLLDCIRHPEVVRGLYDVAVTTLAEEKKG